MSSNHEILVEIAAYRDPDLLNTVRSALLQADSPDDIHFSICYQDDDLDNCYELQKNKNCKIVRLSQSEARGPCYARYLCQQLLADEAYVFQIDSHMRFVKHWDTEMIRQLLSFDDPRAMISSYPPGLNDEMGFAPIDDSVFDYPAYPTINTAKSFRDPNEYFVQFGSIAVNDPEAKSQCGPFIAAGNFFAFADAHREVLHDPEMCWCGDELPMAIRYFTHGWNNYTPSKNYAYHKYHRKNRVVFSGYPEGKKREEKRLRQLLNLDNQNYDLGKFGLGQQRTLAQFEQFSTIDFHHRTIGEAAKHGHFGNYSDFPTRTT